MSPHRFRRSRARRRAAVIALVLAVCSTLLVGGVATAADEYTQSVSSLNATQAQISFTPTTPAVYVDVHYIVTGQGQQNFRMDLSGGTWRKTVSGLSSGTVVDYWFTYEKSGPQYDTPHFSYTHGGTTTPTVATPAFSPAGGNYATAQTVTIATATAGATIRYTTDGTTPTASSTLYSGPISVATSRTISAIGLKAGSTNSAVASATYTIGSTPISCTTQPDVPNFGPNTRIFDPSMSNTAIQAQLDADFNAQKDTLTHQMGTGRIAHLFKPGAYSVHDDVGYYTSVAGLGQNPGDVVINGAITVDAFNESDQGVALQNFWRSAENLAVNPIGGSNRWAVAQAAPFRRMDIRGNLQLYPASYGFASGGYIADSKISGQTASISQQQWYTRDSNLGSWDGGVWNMVFSGTPAPRRPRSRTRPRRRSRPRRSPATSRTSTSTTPASTASSPRPCAPTPPAPAGRTAPPRGRRSR